MFKSIGKGVKKLQGSNNPVLLGLKNFGKGMSHADPEAGIGETLAMGAAGVGLGAVGGKLDKELDPVSKPKEMPKITPQGGPRPRIEVEGIDLAPDTDDLGARRKRSAIMRGLNQMDDLGADR